MQRQTNEDEKQEVLVEFQQCPVCESYEVAEKSREYCCNRCGIAWVAVRNWE